MRIGVAFATGMALAAGAARSSSGAADHAIGPWGAAVKGLRCRLVANEAAVPMGARVAFQLHFRFQSQGVDPKINLLNRFLHPRCVTVTFADRRTGRAFGRHPDGGVAELPMRPRADDLVLLRDAPVRPELLSVRLLTLMGQQLPPGTYSVVATYENDGKPLPAGYAARWKLWTGRISAAPITLTVTPAAAREVEVKFHSALGVKRVGDGIGCTWSEKDPQVLRLRRRPGFLLGMRHETHVFLGGVEVPCGVGGLASAVWRAGGTSFLPGDVVRRALAGEPLRVRADVVIFETAVPAGHMWNPTAGGYRVLWRGSVEGRLPAGE